MMIMTQTNLLLCLVNDTIDLKLIEQGRFINQLEKFQPREVFQFILNTFKVQFKMKNYKLTF